MLKWHITLTLPYTSKIISRLFRFKRGAVEKTFKSLLYKIRKEVLIKRSLRDNNRNSFDKIIMIEYYVFCHLNYDSTKRSFVNRLWMLLIKLGGNIYIQKYY
jgi:hypothetical protein